jgi:YebC/PmpR family DNA-binding regulatory protein
MAGHSKWSKVKHIKGVLDVRRGRLFSKLSKEITVAARLGGGNPDFNPRLRAGIQAAKDASMPAENIERAIKKGTGELSANALEEMQYEGYGAGGVAVLLEAATDNKNRTAAELRTIFGKHGGNLASSGSVSYQFQRRGIMRFPLDLEEEKLLEAVLEAGAENMQTDDSGHIVTTAPDQLYAVVSALREAGFPPEDPELIFQPDIIQQITDEETARRVLRLHDALEDCDDVLRVHMNFDLPPELWQALSSN